MGNPVYATNAQTDRVDSLVDSAGATYYQSAGRTRVAAPGGASNGAATQLVELVGPTTFKSATATASGNTAVWTPTSTKKFRLLKFMVLVTADAQVATGPELMISFQDATTDIGLTFSVFVPTTAITTTPGEAFNSGWIDIGGIGIVSAVADNVLSINLSEALTEGLVSVIVAGTED